MNGSWPSLAPDGSEIHIWWIALDAGDVNDSILSAGDRGRASRFRDEGDRTRWIRSRCALRQLLSGYTEVSAAALQIRQAHGRKPEIDSVVVKPVAGNDGSASAGEMTGDHGNEGRSPIRFNLAHAADRALLMVAWDREVGVDLEAVDGQRDVDVLITAACTPGEASRIAALPNHERAAALFSLWTMKEAYLKGIGTGLTRDPRSIEIVENGFGEATVRDSQSGIAGITWRLLSLDAGKGWAAAAAVSGDPVTTRHFLWPQETVNDCPLGS